MVTQSEILELLEAKLEVEKFTDVDFALNGPQINYQPESIVKRIYFAVDSTFEVIHKAIEKKADVLVVHHGQIWGNKKSRTFEEKEKLLKEANCSLWAFHLPLDCNMYIGNSISMAKILFPELIHIKPFGKIKDDLYVGIKGKLRKTKDSPAMSIAVIAGTGGDFIKEAVDSKIDLFITGDLRYQDRLELIDGTSKLKIETVGHHRSEKHGMFNFMASCWMFRLMGIEDMNFLDVSNEF